MIQYCFGLSFAILLASTGVAEIPTSCSDTNNYNQFCKTAVEDPVVFAQFKSSPYYIGILEHVSYEQGRLYLDEIKKQSPEILDHIETFRKNDAIGSPKTYYYDEVGEISPTTLRYIKVASDLKLLFGDALEQASVVEIGGGYGGQCKILSDLYSFKSYTIVDLPWAIRLTEKYLKKHNVPSVFFKKHSDPIPEQNFDLVIANYSFCECSEAMQDKYVREILSHARRGYLLCNIGNAEITPTKEEMLKKFSNVGIQWKILSDPVFPNSNNYLLIWK